MISPCHHQDPTHLASAGRVGNGWENIVIIPAPALYDRERESRTEKRIRYYGISGTEYFDRERVDYDRESITQNGNIDIHVTT